MPSDLARVYDSANERDYAKNLETFFSNSKES